MRECDCYCHALWVPLMLGSCHKYHLLLQRLCQTSGCLFVWSSRVWRCVALRCSYSLGPGHRPCIHSVEPWYGTSISTATGEPNQSATAGLVTQLLVICSTFQQLVMWLFLSACKEATRGGVEFEGVCTARAFVFLSLPNQSKCIESSGQFVPGLWLIDVMSCHSLAAHCAHGYVMG